MQRFDTRSYQTKLSETTCNVHPNHKLIKMVQYWNLNSQLLNMEVLQNTENESVREWYLVYFCTILKHGTLERRLRLRRITGVSIKDDI